MPRFSIVLAALPLAAASALLAARAAADAPPPDRFGPCEGLQAGAACYAAGCTCTPVTEGCPGGAASCLSCETASGGWCGPTNYHAPDAGGCSCSAPAGAAALGAVGLALLARRRPRR